MEDNRQRYEVECPICQYKFYACKSIGHEMGTADAGMGSCPSCNTFLNLTFNEEDESMVATDWKVFMEVRNGNKKNESIC